MYKIRKGDTVWVNKGKDAGKKGRVINIMPGGKLALVEGVNLVKKHKRKTQQDQQGGIVSIEKPLSCANLMYFCKLCEKPARIGFAVSKEGTKARFCKNCKGTL
ncbi:MAG: 50S ribosomal protein L24 [Candidatus Omnitrophica bacterium]|nr:50S ribosomal protein L24 [Candidatus Omnitrophota bacterium]